MLFLLPFHFSYTKNLSSDKINLSTFRGEGELSNLQLDENVLTELLELPSWLRLTSAWCNHVSFRISWTKLKSVPITLVSGVFFRLSREVPPSNATENKFKFYLSKNPYQLEFRNGFFLFYPF